MYFIFCWIALYSYFLNNYCWKYHFAFFINCLLSHHYWSSHWLWHSSENFQLSFPKIFEPICIFAIIKTYIQSSLWAIDCLQYSLLCVYLWCCFVWLSSYVLHKLHVAGLQVFTHWSQDLKYVKNFFLCQHKGSISHSLEHKEMFWTLHTAYYLQETCHLQ